MNFKYCYTSLAAEALEIKDIGNCAIEAFNDNNLVSYLIIKTTIGTTNIVVYGPILLDVNMFPKNVSCIFKRISFNEGKIIKEITSFLLNPKFQITQAFEITREEALDRCRSIIDYMKVEENY